MPSCITHAVVGACVGTVASSGAASRRVLLFSVIAAMLPDIDVLAFAFGIPYEHLFGHRGFFHSISFAALGGLLIAWVFFRGQRYFSLGVWFASCYFSALIFLHGVLDAFTNGGEGVAFFAPFTNARIFFDFTPIEVSPVNLVLFFDGRGSMILANEFVWVWMPALAAAGLARMLLAVCRKRVPMLDGICRKAGPDS